MFNSSIFDFSEPESWSWNQSWVPVNNTWEMPVVNKTMFFQQPVVETASMTTIIIALCSFAGVCFAFTGCLWYLIRKMCRCRKKRWQRNADVDGYLHHREMEQLKKTIFMLNESIRQAPSLVYRQPSMRFDLDETLK